MRHETFEGVSTYLLDHLLEWGGFMPCRPWGAAVGAALEEASALGLIVNELSGTLTTKGKILAGRYHQHKSSLAAVLDVLQGVQDVPNAPEPGIDATLAERGKNYGEFDGHARITQGIKRAMQEGTKWELLADDQKEALEMVAHKIGRILNGDPNYHDSWHDCIGYLRLVEKRLEK